MTNLLTLVSWMQTAASMQQIFYSNNLSSVDLNLSSMGFDTEQRIYPVIKETENCSYFPLKSCPLAKFDWDNLENICSLSSKCPKGTQPSCVENNENEPRLVLMICSPKQQCERDARHIVGLDQNKPNASTYQIIKIPCQDGFFHPQGNDCFNECQEIQGIKLFRKSTPQKGPIAFCDYQLDYCYAEGPSLFELVDLTSPCYPAYTRGHNTCPAGFERKFDCACQPRCEGNEMRDPEDDFKCERQSDRITLEHMLVTPYGSGFRFEWNIPQSKDLIVNSVQIAYKSTDSEETKITESLTSVIHWNRDVTGLSPGKLYSISASCNYTYKEMSHNASRNFHVATRPEPVVNLTLTFDGGTIFLFWAAPKGSWQDYYIIDHRAIRRNPFSSWKSSKTPNVTFTLHDTFPGEEYEFRVFGVSNGTSSTKIKAVCIVPPLSPEKLIHYFKSSTLTIEWYHDEKRTRVENYRLLMISSDGKVQKEVKPPENGGHVEKILLDIRPGRTYNVTVQSLVADVVSTSESLVVTAPDAETNRQSQFPVYGIVILLVLVPALVVVGVVFLVYKVRKWDRTQVIYNTKIDKIENTINNQNGDITLNGDLVGLVDRACSKNNYASNELNSSDEESDDG